MKKLVLTMILLSASLFAGEINWAKDFQSGAATAKQEGKPVLFVFSRHSCKYCKILENTTFSDERVIKALNKDFVSIIAYSDEGDKFPQMLWRPGTPTLW
ncbi:MAG: thioredoxin family protein, partial [Sulfurimonas sp.]